MKFAHIADCHLGGWRQAELQELNFLSFQKVVERVINERVDFVLLAGDLFDSAYPPIEILKEAFAEFKKIKEAGIPVYLIAGSHDFSASGRTFLDVLERAGFCKNVEDVEEMPDGRLKLKPTMHDGIAIYGYPGRKSGMEIDDLKKVYYPEVNQFTIFMLHTTLKDVVGTIPMDSLEKEKLPLANYYALGHIHKRWEGRMGNSVYVYPGPTYPNNFQELVDLQSGSFNLVEVSGGKIKTENVLVSTREVIYVEVELDDGLTATQTVIQELDKRNLREKIVMLRLKGLLKKGKTGDINFKEIEDFATKKQAYVFLRNISQIKTQEMEFELQTPPTDNVENLERQIIGEYTRQNPTNFDKYLPTFMNALSMEKKEDEKSAVYEERLLEELKNVLELKGVL